MQDHYLRDFVSESGVGRLIEILPAAEGKFRERVIDNLGWLRSERAVGALETIADKVLVHIRRDASDAWQEPTYTAQDLDDLSLALSGLIRLQVPGWQAAVVGLWQDEAISEPVRGTLLPVLGWDGSSASAAILARYAVMYDAEVDSESSALGKQALRLLRNRFDQNAFRTLQQVFEKGNEHAAGKAAEILASRHDEEAARWIANQILQGDNSRILSLYGSRLPWVPAFMESVILNGDAQTWKKAFTYNNSIHRSKEVADLAAKIALQDVSVGLRLAAVEGMDTNPGHDNPVNWRALQKLADDGDAAVRQNAMNKLGGFGFNDHEENRRFLMTRAESGSPEAAAQFSQLLGATEGAQRQELVNLAIDLADTGSGEVKEAARKQLGHFASYTEGQELRRIIDLLIATADTGDPDEQETAISQMRRIWGPSRSVFTEIVSSDAPYYDDVVRTKRKGSCGCSHCQCDHCSCEPEAPTADG